MLASLLIRRACFFFMILCLLHCLLNESYAQGLLSEDMRKCYVVVGAFQLEGNASRFGNALSSKNLEAEYKLNTFRDLYYVYTYSSQDREEAKSELFQVRERYPDLSNSWLYAGDFNGPHITSLQWPDYLKTGTTNTISPKKISTKATARSLVDDSAPTPVSVIVKEEDTPGTRKFYFNTVNATTLKEVPGIIQVLDGERNKLIMEANAHQLSKVKVPNNNTNRIKIESDVFGYRDFEYAIDLDEVENDEMGIIEQIGDTILVNLELLRYNRGDIIPMWKVYFYKDAAIMKQESVEELTHLLDMLEENEKMRIRIHGHTNGNSFGKVLHLDLDDKQFFSLNGSHEEDNASAKKLSLYRAYTLQHWLMDQGIAENRLEIKGWGGKKMIYDKHDPQARKNVRVEIEILED